MRGEAEVRRLQRDLTENRELWRRMETACERIAQRDADISRSEAIFRAANECGYAVTLDDIKNSLAAFGA